MSKWKSDEPIDSFNNIKRRSRNGEGVIHDAHRRHDLRADLVRFGGHARLLNTFCRSKRRWTPPKPRQKPDGSVKFFFGKESTPRIASSLGSVKPHGKARTRRSDDIEACNVAFLAALMDFEQRAKKAGANAVVNIVSYYKNVEMASATKFECHAGAAAHAILRGDLVKLVD